MSDIDFLVNMINESIKNANYDSQVYIYLEWQYHKRSYIRNTTIYDICIIFV